MSARNSGRSKFLSNISSLINAWSSSSLSSTTPTERNNAPRSWTGIAPELSVSNFAKAALSSSRGGTVTLMSDIIPCQARCSWWGSWARVGGVEAAPKGLCASRGMRVAASGSLTVERRPQRRTQRRVRPFASVLLPLASRGQNQSSPPLGSPWGPVVVNTSDISSQFIPRALALRP